jgi:hypothetical protein
VWALTTPPLLVLTGTPVLSVMTQHGASVAAIPGHVPPGPWRVLSLGLVCLVLLAAKDRSGAVRLIVGGALGLLASAAILLALAGGGLDLTQYYPQKVLWFLALFLSPLLVTVIAWALVVTAVPLWRSAGRLPHGFVLRSSLVALTTVVVLAGWLPWRIGAGIASVNALQVADDHSFNQPNRSAQRHEIATRYGPALQPRIVVPYVVGASAMVDPRGTQRVSSLLSFLTGQQAIAGDPPSVCKAIRIMAGTREAVVISKLPRSRVLANMRRNGCASRAEVLHVPGGIRDAAHSKY